MTNKQGKETDNRTPNKPPLMKSTNWIWSFKPITAVNTIDWIITVYKKETFVRGFSLEGK
jgi:hypothetical protein